MQIYDELYNEAFTCANSELCSGEEGELGLQTKKRVFTMHLDYCAMERKGSSAHREEKFLFHHAGKRGLIQA